VDRSSVQKPDFKKEIGVSVFMSMKFSASVMFVCGIIGDTFEIIIRFVEFSNLRISMLWLSTVIVDSDK